MFLYLSARCRQKSRFEDLINKSVTSSIYSRRIIEFLGTFADKFIEENIYNLLMIV